MILLLIGLCGLAAFRLSDTALFVPAAANAVASFWGNGVMANYRHDPHNAPGLATMVSMLTAFAGVVLLILSFVVA